MQVCCQTHIASLRSTFYVCFLFLREEMSRDCEIRLEKMDLPGDDNCQQITLETEVITSSDIVDSKTSACDKTEVLQEQSTTDPQSNVCEDATTDPQSVVCEDATQSVNDLNMSENNVGGADCVNSPTSDDDYLVIDADENDDNASNDKVGMDFSLQNSRGSDDAVEKTYKKDDLEEAMCLSCVGTSVLQTMKANRQYQPFVRLKKLDPTEIKRWTTARKSEPRMRDKGGTGDSKYVIFWLYLTTTHFSYIVDSVVMVSRPETEL